MWGKRMQYFFGRLQPKSVKSVASYRLTESCPAGYNNLNMTLGETGGVMDAESIDRR